MVKVTHDLKCWPIYFAQVAEGTKTFEVRVNDRNFRQGDAVMLREWRPDDKTYTGNDLHFVVGYVLPLDESRVVFSLLPESVPLSRNTKGETP